MTRLTQITRAQAEADADALYKATSDYLDNPISLYRQGDTDGYARAAADVHSTMTTAGLTDLQQYVIRMRHLTLSPVPFETIDSLISRRHHYDSYAIYKHAFAKIGTYLNSIHPVHGESVITPDDEAWLMGKSKPDYQSFSFDDYIYNN